MLAITNPAIANTFLGPVRVCYSGCQLYIYNFIKYIYFQFCKYQEKNSIKEVDEQVKRTSSVAEFHIIILIFTFSLSVIIQMTSTFEKYILFKT